jgi:hypothetical protein
VVQGRCRKRTNAAIAVGLRGRDDRVPPVLVKSSTTRVYEEMDERDTKKGI